MAGGTFFLKAHHTKIREDVKMVVDHELMRERFLRGGFYPYISVRFFIGALLVR